MMIRRPNAQSRRAEINYEFDLTLALPGQASSRHTHRAYYRWVDGYLVDLAGMPAVKGQERLERMRRLPVAILQALLTPPQLRAWLGMLVGRGHGKQGLSQARAAIVTLAGLLAEAGWLDDYTSAALSRVRAPRAEDGQRSGRWLSTEHLRALIAAAEQIATSDNQRLRNRVALLILCTMALRREELTRARWDDLSLQNERVVLRVHGKGRSVATIDVPRPVVDALTRWRAALIAQKLPPTPQMPLLRRLWKGGRVSRNGLTPEGIWEIVSEASEAAGIGHVAPHDLRRSVAGALHENGTPIETISRLLRHRNIAVTERYLSKLPQKNEGGGTDERRAGVRGYRW